METPESKPRLRPRISLLSLLLLTAIVALSLALWGESSRRWPLEREIQALRREVGEVAVADPTKMYVQPLDNSVDNRMHFRWRAYVPPGRAGVVTVLVQQPWKNREGYLTMTLDAGDSGFELVTLPAVAGDLWMYSLRSSSTVRRSGSSNPRPPWLGQGGEPVGLTFDDFDPQPGVAEGHEAALMDLAGQSENGEPVRVIVTAKHYPPANLPPSSNSAGHQKLNKNQP
ncbi:hypothetical protein Pla108_29800 [Botrimarina colliarenosi]|uniref:Uncharacterized protein n=1 Tax=Botrimarina colliarenosi TaxID=2528001 RepID=A0A5C6ACC1_9BACT|nr:hypothetical protein [Botrimarina colliarenosi]TWT95903.1 hypothetical protein Pla108_29800 [Botrimarina colliarenosi]